MRADGTHPRPTGSLLPRFERLNYSAPRTRLRALRTTCLIGKPPFRMPRIPPSPDEESSVLVPVFFLPTAMATPSVACLIVRSYRRLARALDTRQPWSGALVQQLRTVRAEGADDGLHCPRIGG